MPTVPEAITTSSGVILDPPNVASAPQDDASHPSEGALAPLTAAIAPPDVPPTSSEDLQPTQLSGTPITTHEVCRVLRHARQFSAPGIDCIPVAFYKKLLHIVLPYLLVLYNSSMCLGHLLTPWRHSLIIPIPKHSTHGYKVDNM